MLEERITVVETDTYTAWCYPDNGIIHHQFNRPCRGDEFRTPMLQAAEAFEKYHCTKWLSDDRKFGPLDPEDWKWGEVHFTDRIIKKGWKYSAMVLPEDMFGKISTSALVDYFDAKGVEAKFFTYIEKAKQWLHSK
jgi:hypothetical protein